VCAVGGRLANGKAGVGEPRGQVAAVPRLRRTSGAGS
jgi:hypothetical protein